jgi:hypothetical protein
MTLFPSAFGSLEVGFNNNEIDTLTWNGTVVHHGIQLTTDAKWSTIRF